MAELGLDLATVFSFSSSPTICSAAVSCFSSTESPSCSSSGCSTSSWLIVGLIGGKSASELTLVGSLSARESQFFCVKTNHRQSLFIETFQLKKDRMTFSDYFTWFTCAFDLGYCFRREFVKKKNGVTTYGALLRLSLLFDSVTRVFGSPNFFDCLHGSLQSSLGYYFPSPCEFW